MWLLILSYFLHTYSQLCLDHIFIKYTTFFSISYNIIIIIVFLTVYENIF